MAVLGRERIIGLLEEPRIEDRLIITPLLSRKQIGDASVDLRLSHSFIATKRGNLPAISPASKAFDEERYQSRHNVNLRSPFYLHPGELVLASTLEYLRMPVGVAGIATSRSSWGRAGLVIATAFAVHPGFTGTLTLELVNQGQVPLVLYPGICVAQLILSECEGATLYEGRFARQVDAQPSSLSSDTDEDFDFWTGGSSA